MGQGIDPDWLSYFYGSDPSATVGATNDVADRAIPMDNKDEMSMAEWVARMSLLAKTNREAYRVLREQMWRFVQQNSSRSDFPSNMS